MHHLRGRMNTCPIQSMIRKSVQRFSEKIMRKLDSKARWRFNLIPSRFSQACRVVVQRHRGGAPAGEFGEIRRPRSIAPTAACSRQAAFRIARRIFSVLRPSAVSWQWSPWFRWQGAGARSLASGGSLHQFLVKGYTRDDRSALTQVSKRQALKDMQSSRKSFARRRVPTDLRSRHEGYRCGQRKNDGAPEVRKPGAERQGRTLQDDGMTSFAC